METITVDVDEFARSLTYVYMDKNYHYMIKFLAVAQPTIASHDNWTIDTHNYYYDYVLTFAIDLAIPRNTLTV